MPSFVSGLFLLMICLYIFGYILIWIHHLLCLCILSALSVHRFLTPLWHRSSVCVKLSFWWSRFPCLWVSIFVVWVGTWSAYWMAVHSDWQRDCCTASLRYGKRTPAHSFKSIHSKAIRNWHGYAESLNLLIVNGSPCLDMDCWRGNTLVNIWFLYISCLILIGRLML